MHTEGQTNTQKVTERERETGTVSEFCVREGARERKYPFFHFSYNRRERNSERKNERARG